MTAWVGRTAKAALNLAVLGLVGWIAYRWYVIIPSAIHGAVFTGGSVVAAALVALSTQVFGKFDKLLQDSEKYGAVRTARIYAYVGAVRRRLVWWILAAFVALVGTAGAAYLLKEPSLTGKRWATVVGYVALSTVALAAMRVVSAYLRVDSFRLELFKAIENERIREETIRAMRPTSRIRDFSAEPTLTPVGPRQALK